MYDPTSTVSAPPPRYSLESDSSDEEGQGQYGMEGVRAPKLRVSAPEISSRPLGEFKPPSQVQNAVVGVGQAGSYLLRSTGGRAKPLFSIEAEGDRLGTAVQLEGGESSVAVKDGKDWDVVRKLLDNVQATRWTMVSTYLPALYIPEEGEEVIQPSVRALPPTEGIASYTAPNYVTGIAGAFLSSAAHPASKLDVSSRLLPLPLSGSPRTASSTSPIKVMRPLWTEADDEPFLAPGMGKRPTETRQEDTGGMYM